MRRRLAYLTIALLLSSCVKETDWEPGPSGEPVIVVDGIITDIQGVQEIRLSYSVNDLNEPPPPVSEASVLISNQDSSWQLAENPPYSGVYQTPEDFVAIPDKDYTLFVSNDGKIFSAKTAMEPGKLFDPLTYKISDDGTLYRIDWIASAFTADFPAMWEIITDWSQVPGYEDLDSADTHARLLFYTLPTLDVSQLFAPKVEEIRFPAGTLITENRYSLTSEHAEFIRELLMETSWQGGLFSSVPANVTTNLSKGAVGWFGACGKTSLSLVVAR